MWWARPQAEIKLVKVGVVAVMPSVTIFCVTSGRGVALLLLVFICLCLRILRGSKGFNE